MTHEEGTPSGNRWQRQGRVWALGDDVNTDVLHPPQYFSLDPEVVKRGLFQGIDPGMQAQVRPGDVVVAGRNFGCGSSRETSIRSFLLNGIAAVIAVDFARIFFRSATNQGLPCVTFADRADRSRLQTGDLIRVELVAGWLDVRGERLPLEPPGPFVRRIWEAGGLLGLLR